jgi:hypothetical protein
MAFFVAAIAAINGAASNNSLHGDGAVVISLAGTQKCLDLSGGETAAGTLVQLWDCNGTPNQRWLFSAGSWQIRFAAKSNMCLDNLSGGAAGNKLGLWGCNGGSNQRWGYDSGEETVYLASSTEASLCMDVPGDDTTDGSHIQVWGCNGHTNQQWSVQTAPPPPSPGPGGGCYAKSGISAAQLGCVFTRLASTDAARFAGELNTWMGDSLTNACKWSAFLANVGTESAGLTEWTQVP